MDDEQRHEQVAEGITSEDLEQDVAARYESPRYQRWVARTRKPLDWLAIVFLVDIVLIWSFPEATGIPFWVLQGISWFVWGCFVVDYFVRLALASDRVVFAKSHKLDLLMVMVPMLRLLRVVLLLRKTLTSVSTERIASSIVGVAASVVGIAAFLVWRVESVDPAANIHTFRESLWWAVVTVTTVGYGNYYPVTPQGELIASALMLVGISLIGTISATVAAWFVRRPVLEDDDEPPAPAAAPAVAAGPAPSDADGMAAVLARLDALAQEQAALRDLLEGRGKEHPRS